MQGSGASRRSPTPAALRCFTSAATPRVSRRSRSARSFGRFELLRGSQRSFEIVASYSPASLTLSGDGDAELVQGERVSPSYFQLLRVGAARGRLFTDAEDDPAARHR
jgi:hypothetical protein